MVDTDRLRGIMSHSFESSINFCKSEIQKIRKSDEKNGESGGAKYPKFGQRVNNSGYSKKR